MASVAAITELEAKLSEAREAAGHFLEECTRAIEAEEFSWHEFPAHLVPKARELSAGFHTPLYGFRRSFASHRCSVPPTWTP
jgi:hypothetical protein